MSPVYEEWMDGLGLKDRERADFERWFFVAASGVLVGDKSGELIMLNGNRDGLSVDARIEVVEELCCLWGCSCMLLCRCEKGAKVIVYERERVSAALGNVPGWAVRRLGYEPGLNPEEFLSQLGQRWSRSGRIPHEIGVSLGYPVKDVLGFMGLLDLECTGCCGWKIYGSPEESLTRKRGYSRARHDAIAFVGTHEQVVAMCA